jgi:hypothetical protein
VHQHGASGGHTALDWVKNQKLIITKFFGLFIGREFDKASRMGLICDYRFVLTAFPGIIVG